MPPGAGDKGIDMAGDAGGGVSATCGAGIANGVEPGRVCATGNETGGAGNAPDKGTMLDAGPDAGTVSGADGRWTQVRLLGNNRVNAPVSVSTKSTG